MKKPAAPVRCARPRPPPRSTPDHRPCRSRWRRWRGSPRGLLRRCSKPRKPPPPAAPTARRTPPRSRPAESGTTTGSEAPSHSPSAGPWRSPARASGGGCPAGCFRRWATGGTAGAGGLQQVLHGGWRKEGVRTSHQGDAGGGSRPRSYLPVLSHLPPSAGPQRSRVNAVGRGSCARSGSGQIVAGGLDIRQRQGANPAPAGEGTTPRCRRRRANSRRSGAPGGRSSASLVRRRGVPPHLRQGCARGGGAPPAFPRRLRIPRPRPAGVRRDSASRR